MRHMAQHLRAGLLAAACIFFSSGIDLSAQFNFTAREGIETATTTAKEALGNDAELIMIATPGSFDYQGLNLSFDLNTGKSNIWMYIFHSPSSGELASYMVVRLLTYQTFDLGTVPFPLPDTLINSVDMSGTYANSDAMVNRLKTDTAYQKYRKDLPDAKPQFISIGQMFGGDSLDLPNGFPIGQSTWTVSFSGSEDSTMTCFVASKTGEAFCRRVYGIASSVDQREGMSVSMQVAPNPSAGRVGITMQGYTPAQLSGCRLMLFNTAGEMVSDLTSSLHEQGNGRAEFSVEGLPPGPYHCLLTGNGIRTEVGIIVIE